MRRVTPEAVRAEQLRLASLLDDWQRMNRKAVSRDLRNSLYTKIEETKAFVAAMEATLARASRAQRRSEPDASGAAAAG